MPKLASPKNVELTAPTLEFEIVEGAIRYDIWIKNAVGICPWKLQKIDQPPGMIKRVSVRIAELQRDRKIDLVPGPYTAMVQASNGNMADDSDLVASAPVTLTSDNIMAIEMAAIRKETRDTSARQCLKLSGLARIVRGMSMVEAARQEQFQEILEPFDSMKKQLDESCDRLNQLEKRSSENPAGPDKEAVASLQQQIIEMSKKLSELEKALASKLSNDGLDSMFSQMEDRLAKRQENVADKALQDLKNAINPPQPRRPNTSESGSTLQILLFLIVGAALVAALMWFYSGLHQNQPVKGGASASTEAVTALREATAALKEVAATKTTESGQQPKEASCASEWRHKTPEELAASAEPDDGAGAKKARPHPVALWAEVADGDGNGAAAFDAYQQYQAQLYGVPDPGYALQSDCYAVDCGATSLSIGFYFGGGHYYRSVGGRLVCYETRPVRTASYGFVVNAPQIRYAQRAPVAQTYHLVAGPVGNYVNIGYRGGKR